MFQVQILDEWTLFELPSFLLLGVFGVCLFLIKGLFGALFIKSTRILSIFRAKMKISKNPLLEVVLIAVMTSLVSELNYFTRYIII